jgi:hypothetical protein
MAAGARGVRFAFHCWKFVIVTLVLCAIVTVAAIAMRQLASDTPEIRQLHDDWVVRHQPGAFERYTDALDNTAARFGTFVGLGAMGLGGIAMMSVAVCFAVMLYKLWQQVQDGKARATPGQALGYLFVPFFSFYWIFVVTKGLAEELNRCARQHNLDIKPASIGLMLTYCILTLAAIVPLLGILAVVINLGVGIAAFGSATKVAVALAEDRDRNTV